MFRAIYSRIKQKYRTIPFPKKEPVLVERYRGLPILDESKCADNCNKCIEACPTNAILKKENHLEIDSGKCLFCMDCKNACPHGVINFSNKDYRLAVCKREDLIFKNNSLKLAEATNKEIKRVFGRSLKLRQVSAGGCNGCESDVNVLNTLTYDLGRFGIQFVASPRHADGLLITGPVTQNMKLALKKTYDAVPHPKIVIAVGACAISGGPYIGHAEACDGVDHLFPVDLYIPGCVPHPMTILDGLLRVLGKR